MIEKNEIIKIIKDIDLDININENDFNKTLKEIGLDSLDTFNLISEIETVFNKKISDDSFVKIKSLNDLLNLLNNVEEV
jgi:acyl carrier protein